MALNIMRIIMLGAPGSGKGTQAQFIMNKYSIPQISTGNILRAAVKEQSSLSDYIKEFIDAGKLVTDELIITLVKNFIKQNCQNGFVLDGFPRTMYQANALKEEGIIVDCVIELVVPDSIIIERIAGRMIHTSSNRIYHLKFNPPREKGKDDITGETLITRKDDQENIIRKRLKEYYKQTTPLIKYYREESYIGNNYYYTIDGTLSANKIHNQLNNILHKHLLLT